MPPPTHLLAFAAVAAVVVAVPGPSLLFTIGRALTVGRGPALFTVLGNGIGLLAQVALVAGGLGALLAASATAYTLVKLAGAAYLVWLGVDAIRHRRRLGAALGSGRRGTTGAWASLRTGVLVGVTNAKTVVFLSSLLPQFVDPAGPAAGQMLVLGTAFAAMAVVGDSVWALAAGRARDWFAGRPRRLEAVGGAGGVMMVGLGVTVAVTGRPD